MHSIRCALSVLVGGALLLPPSVCGPGDAHAAPPADGATARVAIQCRVLRVFANSPAGPIDLVAARLAAGDWRVPQEGDVFALPDGQHAPWQTVRAENGTFQHELLQGGYASIPIESPAQQVLVLQVQGRHRAVHVNGSPRVGNFYDHGYVRLPVLLNEGANELLVHGLTGSLKVSLEPPGADAVINTADRTVPDLIVDQPTDALAAVTIMNATEQALTGLRIESSGDLLEPFAGDLPPIAPLAVRKVPFRIRGPAPKAGGTTAVTLKVVRQTGATPETLTEATVELDVRQPDEPYRRTFLSGIDRSVQYYAVTPANPGDDCVKRPALFLTLHGANVEAIGQARAYSSKSWGHIVAATNRSPWGFDWEDWGRLDALEVLADAQQYLGTDPRRTYLTGHSMGGHGVWHIGATHPDRFAAIGPSAGWISFSTYGGGQPAGDGNSVEELLRRAASSSDTLALMQNHRQHGVYLLHGADDDNVPAGQARRMVQELAQFHQDFASHEEPRAGHWWDHSDQPGADCVDWAPLFEFFARHSIPESSETPHVHFTTANPGVSATCQWVEVLAQAKPLRPATVDVRLNGEQRLISGTTDNVLRLAFDLAQLGEGAPPAIELDGQKLAGVEWPADTRRIWLEQNDDKWSAIPRPSADQRGPHRYGAFKDAFRNEMLFVYGTAGDSQENEANYDKARLDAETFWYRGNGAVELIPDREFEPTAEPDRNIILFGNADTNSAWAALLPDCPKRPSARRNAAKTNSSRCWRTNCAIRWRRSRRRWICSTCRSWTPRCSKRRERQWRGRYSRWCG